MSASSSSAALDRQHLTPGLSSRTEPLTRPSRTRSRLSQVTMASDVAPASHFSSRSRHAAGPDARAPTVVSPRPAYTPAKGDKPAAQGGRHGMVLMRIGGWFKQCLFP